MDVLKGPGAIAFLPSGQKKVNPEKTLFGPPRTSL